MTVCSQCGDEYVGVGNHWNRSQCDYPTLTQRQWEIVTGLLMGDGTILLGDGSPRMRVKMITRPFLKWIKGEFGSLCTDIQLAITAEDNAAHCRENGLDPNAKAENYSDVFRLSTRNLPCLDEFEQWYSSGRKRFPSDISLTPLISKVWYCCDGSLRVHGNDRPSAYFVATNEMDRSDFLVSLFEEWGFDPTFSGKSLRLDADDTEQLFDWMGDPLPGFEYKWGIYS